MNKSDFLVFLSLSVFIMTGISGAFPLKSESVRFDVIQRDSLPENQILYNGRIWRNLYYRLEEDQFLFSKVFLPGSLTIRGKTFTDVSIKYDLYKDELLTPVNSGRILQLNKEMVDSFSFLFQNKTYRFIRMPEDTLKGLKGYVNVLHKGKTALYVKYEKKIDQPTVLGEYDKFYLITRIYIMKDNIAHLITDKSDLLRVFDEDKKRIRDFIKKNKLTVSRNMPESFIPIIRYCDSLSQ